MVVAACPFAPLLAPLRPGAEPPVVILLGAAPPGLEAALREASMPFLRLNPADGALEALLYRADAPRPDLLWLDAPEALLGWEPVAGMIAWERQRPVPGAVHAQLQSAGYHLAEAGPLLLARRALAVAPCMGDVVALRGCRRRRRCPCCG